MGSIDAEILPVLVHDIMSAQKIVLGNRSFFGKYFLRGRDDLEFLVVP